MSNSKRTNHPYNLPSVFQRIDGTNGEKKQNMVITLQIKDVQEALLKKNVKLVHLWRKYKMPSGYYLHFLIVTGHFLQPFDSKFFLNMSDIKTRLHHLCIEYADERIATATEAIKAARDSSTEDTKSSAGDKYETGRAMMQQDIDRQTLQLGEAQKLRAFLERMEPEHSSDTVQNGSLAFTDQGIFYIAISLGQVDLDGQKYFVISSASPIGEKLMKQKAGAKFSFNGKDYKIKTIE